MVIVGRGYPTIAAQVVAEEGQVAGQVSGSHLCPQLPKDCAFSTAQLLSAHTREGNSALMPHTHAECWSGTSKKDLDQVIRLPTKPQPALRSRQRSPL